MILKRGKKIGSTLPKRDANAIFNRRAALLSFVGGGVMVAIMGRLGQLQVSDALSSEYTDLADENRFDTRIIAPPRGVIYDRFGTVLAQTSRDYQVVVPKDAEDLEDLVAKVGAILGRDAEWVRRAIIRVRGGSRTEPEPLADSLTWEQFNVATGPVRTSSGFWASRQQRSIRPSSKCGARARRGTSAGLRFSPSAASRRKKRTSA